MTEPRRWKDSPDAPIGVRELLGAARPTRPIDRVVLERGASRVSAIASIPLAAALWPKLAAAVIGVSAIGLVAGVRATRTPDEVAIGNARVLASTPAPSSAATASPRDAVPAPEASLDRDAPVVAPPPSPVVATPQPVPEAPAAAAPSAETATPSTDATRPSASASPASTLAAELALLEGARGALARDPELALERIGAHRARFPRGTLSGERDVLEIDALRRAGRLGDARARAQAWLERDPTGFHAERLRAILGTLEEQSAEPR
ncbi:MAG: hypothetical protein KF819_02055 [Labilithrix sp.]|nr:hypothetical protein [Labilithrix sp.]